jgi:hypothetical protein
MEAPGGVVCHAAAGGFQRWGGGNRLAVRAAALPGASSSLGTNSVSTHASTDTTSVAVNLKRAEVAMAEY